MEGIPPFVGGFFILNTDYLGSYNRGIKEMVEKGYCPLREICKKFFSIIFGILRGIICTDHPPQADDVLIRKR